MEIHSNKTYTCSADHDKKHEMMLDLNLSAQKSDNLFADSDQTPTPTRLIRNCEEVGLFDDLRHVMNPFEETFRRAVEQKTGQTPSSQLPESVESHTNEDSLHTPQVFPQLEAGACNCEMGAKPLDSPPSAAVTLDVPAVDELLRAATDDAFKLATSRQNSNNSTTSSGGYGKFHKYRCSVEKTATTQAIATTTATAPSIVTPVMPLGTMCTMSTAADATTLPFVQLPTIQLTAIQPQVITLTFPDHVNVESTKTRNATNSTQAIPVQTVKPFIMPKLTPTNSAAANASTTTNVTPDERTQQTLLPRVAASGSERLTHEPSSASMTPTSQLPIKERLKVKLSHKKAQRAVELLPPKKSSKRMCDEDCAMRRRAAASRYRNKMRNEHKELKRRTVELEGENEKLRMRVKQLEGEMSKMQQQMMLSTKDSGNLLTMPAKIQIPPTTLQMIMNIPTMVVPTMGQPTLMQPLTYRIEKK